MTLPKGYDDWDIQERSSSGRRVIDARGKETRNISEHKIELFGVTIYKNTTITRFGVGKEDDETKNT